MDGIVGGVDDMNGWDWGMNWWAYLIYPVGGASWAPPALFFIWNENQFAHPHSSSLIVMDNILRRTALASTWM
jgi:hypothetical protein